VLRALPLAERDRRLQLAQTGEHSAVHGQSPAGAKTYTMISAEGTPIHRPVIARSGAPSAADRSASGPIARPAPLEPRQAINLSKHDRPCHCPA
jgi:hypothetical protein